MADAQMQVGISARLRGNAGPLPFSGRVAEVCDAMVEREKAVIGLEKILKSGWSRTDGFALGACAIEAFGRASAATQASGLRGMKPRRQAPGDTPDEVFSPPPPRCKAGAKMEQTRTDRKALWQDRDSACPISAQIKA